MLIADAILGLSPVKLLLHLLNFAILFTCLWLILYKPVMKSIRARQDKIREEKEETERNLTAAKEAQEKAEQKFKEADSEIALKKQKAEKEAAARYDEIVNEASLRAAEIIKDAESEATAQANKALENAKKDIGDMALSIAENIIEKKIDDLDDEMIDSAIKDWKND